jgi:IclR family acetate operon transcriptional repressor
VELIQDGEKQPTRIQSVDRAARLLLWVTAQSDGATASEAARAIGLAVPTTYHLLNTLVASGLLAKDSRRRYGPGPKVAILAEAHLRTDRVPEYLLLPLRALAQSTGETAYLAGWRGREIRAQASVQGTSAVRVAEVERGPYRHAHARATGKLLLAFADEQLRTAYLDANPLERITERTVCDPHELEAELRRIREDGYAVDEEEFIPGVSCVAAPVLEDGIAVATYTVSAPADRFSSAREELLHAVLGAARSASATARGLTDVPDASEAA